MKPQIFVLQGPTINSEAVVQALEVMPHDIDIICAHKGNLEEVIQDSRTLAGIIPGCDSSQNIRNQIGRHGMDALHDFVVKDGGGLAGFCAGGYLMADEIIYGTCFPKKHQRHSKDNLGLINATYYGPLSNRILDYAFKHPDKPYISLVNINTPYTQNLPVVYWHGGVAMLPENQTELRTLASFSEPVLVNSHDDVCETLAPIAIGIKDFSSGGKAISSAVHPEMSGTYLEAYAKLMATLPEHAHYKALLQPYVTTAETLKRHKGGLSVLFETVVDELVDCGKARKNGIKVVKSCIP